MIKTEKVIIEVNNRNISNYRRKLKSEYYLKIGLNEVYTKDLSNGSHCIVEVECDHCFVTKHIEYRSYLKFTKNETEIYCCKACNNVKVRKTNLERYGVVCNSQLDSNKRNVSKKWLSKTDEELKKISRNREYTCLEKYGVESYTKTDEYKTKSKKTWFFKYGVENPSYSEIVKDKRVKTKLEKFGYINNSQSDFWKDRIKEIWENRSHSEIQDINDKRYKTNLEKYGFEHYSKSEEYLEKYKNTCEMKYGYASHNQCPIIHDKQQKSGLKSKNYKELRYQGSYELDFLEKYYERFEINKIEPIQYFLNDVGHYYHPDFYIPDYNLIVEIKSTYTYNYDLDRNLAKRDCSIRVGYNFIFVIDKDYKSLENLIASSSPMG